MNTNASSKYFARKYRQKNTYFRYMTFCSSQYYKVMKYKEKLQGYEKLHLILLIEDNIEHQKLRQIDKSSNIVH